ncbi:putative phosphatase regulatory subunit-domain-containing protein [Lactarius quietus]|nr:putative phosphatase regulatory subunit-domain-containing protein [Lactarius quietus]
MPYVSVATHLRGGDPLRSPVLVQVPLDALARSQLNPDDPLARRLSSFIRPQSKYDIQKFQRRLHTPPRPTPPTRSPASGSPPPSPKSVRFKDSDGELESVCHFRPTGRPSSISHPRSHSDTETETETDSALAAQFAATTATIFKTTEISPIPSPHTPPESNVHLESLTLLPARPPLLRGTVRVRNIAYEKNVAVRFTTDGWTTISEAHARYVGPAPDSGTWDLFAFTIPLQTPRTLLLAVRYAVPGTGEWWDNNGGNNFRVVLAPATLPCPVPVPAAPGFCIGDVSPSARSGLANVAAAKTYTYPAAAQRSLPVPPATNEWLSAF